MKINQIANYFSIALALLGILFKKMHWPGANMLIMTTLLTLIVSTVLSFDSNRRNGLKVTLNYALTLILLFLIVGAGFNLFHWQGYLELRIIGHAILVILPIIMIVFNKEHKVSNSFWVSFLVYIMVAISMMLTNIDSQHEKKSSIETQSVVKQ